MTAHDDTPADCAPPAARKAAIPPGSEAATAPGPDAEPLVADQAASPPAGPGDRALGSDTPKPAAELAAEPAANPAAELAAEPAAKPAAELAANPAAELAAKPASSARARGPDAAERRLVRRLKQGDDRAFQELVHLYQDRVFSLVLRMLNNRQEAEDVAQDVFFSVYRAIGRFRGDAQLYTWIYRIAINACKNRLKYLKGRHLDRQEPIDEGGLRGDGSDKHAAVTLHSPVPGPEAMARGNRLQQAIARELSNLDADHRQVLVLRDIQGLAYEDIAKITGLAEGTVKSRLHRARVALKSRLRSELGEDK